MNKPKPGTLLDRDKYWQAVDADRLTYRDGWCFDFISIHSSRPEPATRPTPPYSLLSPMCLIDPTTGTRPRWEREKFPTKTEAIKKARQLARHHKVFILDCH